MPHPLTVMMEAAKFNPGHIFRSEAEAYDIAATIADESTTYAVEPFGGGYILNAYDETGHWLGRL